MFNKSLKELSVLTFSKDPVPGGGGICGACGALAASLSGMVTNLTIGKKKYLEYNDELEDIKKRMDDLRVSLLSTINEDAQGFYPLSKAYGGDKNSSDYYEVLEKCLMDAAKTPLKIMYLCKEVIDMDERLSVIGSKLAVSDAGTSLSLAVGALKGAYLNVLVNTRLMRNKEQALSLEKEAEVIKEECENKADSIYEAVLKRL